MQALNVRVEIRIHFHLVGIEFQFRAVKQRFRACKSRHNVVHCLNEIDNIGHCPVWHGGSDVAGNRVGQGRAQIALRQFFLPRAFALQNIAETLHQNVPVSQHIRQFAHFLCIGDRLVKRHGKIVRAENGKIRVLALEFFIRMAVYNGKVIIIIFLRNKSARVLAKRAHLVFKRFRISDQFGFVKHVIHRFYDLVSDLNTNADVHRSRLVGDSVIGAEFFQPVRAAPAGCNNGVFSVYLVTVFQANAQAFFAVQDQIAALAVKQNLHAGGNQIFFYGKVEFMRLFRSDVANRAVHQFQPCLYRSFAYFLNRLSVADSFNMRVRAEFQIDLIRIIDRFLRKILADQFRQAAAHFIRKRKFSV